MKTPRNAERHQNALQRRGGLSSWVNLSLWAVWFTVLRKWIYLFTQQTMKQQRFHAPDNTSQQCTFAENTVPPHSPCTCHMKCWVVLNETSWAPGLLACRSKTLTSPHDFSSYLFWSHFPVDAFFFFKWKNKSYLRGFKTIQREGNIFYFCCTGTFSSFWS